ncbi:MAG: FHA domain-containing protein [Planctomycetota bacterium]|jgi:tetratricopeptide (TPR) repeat protein|nr:FHA domain-containing protein [Planctomycetota bacterium]
MRLVCYIDGEKQIYPLKEGTVSIGRSRDCGLVIPTKGVSREHAEITVSGGEITIRDLGSSNGIYVNEQKVREISLADGDLVGLGKFKLTFEGGGAESDATMVDATPVDDAPVDDGSPVRFDDVSTEETDQNDAQEEMGFVEDRPPTQEDTPVDDRFVPVKYEEPEQAGALAVGPQLVQKDGKWYLKDPITDREVEIVPKHQEGADGEEGEPEEVEDAPPQRSPLKLVIVGMGALVVLLVCASILLKPPPPKPGPGGPGKREFVEAVDEGVSLLESRDYEAAKKIFLRAHGWKPDYSVGKVLADVTEKLEAGDADPLSYDWDTLFTHFNTLKNSVYSTSKVEAFAQIKQEWVLDEKKYEAVVSRGLDYLKKNDPEAALTIFQKVPQSSPSFLRAKDPIVKAKASCAAKYEALAKNKISTRDWNSAIPHYEKADQFTDEPDTFSRQIEDIRKWQTHSTFLDEAKEKQENDELEAVLTLLAKVDATSPYRPQSDALKQTVEEELGRRSKDKQLNKVLDLYAAGNGEGALKLIAEENVGLDEPTKAKIRRVVKAMETAESLFKAKEYEKARAKWEEITTIEEDTENGYHRQAVQKLDDFEAQRRRFAVEYERMAEQAMKEKDYPKARRLFGEAQLNDPEGKLGVRGLEALKREAQKAYQAGLTFDGKKEFKQAIAAFKRAMLFAEPGTRHYDDSRRRLGSLELMQD